MAISHANCTHPRTPAGRRACRKSTGLDIKGPTVTIDQVTNDHTISRPKSPVRIQPRRSGARVPANVSTCVQAALHTRGQCACGWEEPKAVSRECDIETDHCETCGMVNPEDDGEGYTTCCNEPIVYSPCGRRHP